MGKRRPTLHCIDLIKGTFLWISTHHSIEKTIFRKMTNKIQYPSYSFVSMICIIVVEHWEYYNSIMKTTLCYY